MRVSWTLVATLWRQGRLHHQGSGSRFLPRSGSFQFGQTCSTFVYHCFLAGSEVLKYHITTFNDTHELNLFNHCNNQLCLRNRISFVVLLPIKCSRNCTNNLFKCSHANFNWRIKELSLNNSDTISSWINIMCKIHLSNIFVELLLNMKILIS